MCFSRFTFPVRSEATPLPMRVLQREFPAQPELDSSSVYFNNTQRIKHKDIAVFDLHSIYKFVQQTG